MILTESSELGFELYPALQSSENLESRWEAHFTAHGVWNLPAKLEQFPAYDTGGSAEFVVETLLTCFSLADPLVLA
ncbi:uncharacterized protein TrAtP1_004840 [Trichoderma atroviride]|uniref:uncharacterized protein n=1 Tax=Hypocrea atroviridis TaxID=63577 RepID=UPI0033300068|nr:hypothetical protein TrAtP1_004840 [Trichoderma atroviride]